MAISEVEALKIIQERTERVERAGPEMGQAIAAVEIANELTLLRLDLARLVTDRERRSKAAK